MNDFSVNIESLALESSASVPDNGQHLAQMTEAALAQLLVQQGLPSGFVGGDVAEIVVPALNWPSNISDQQRAQQLAFVLYQALSGVR